MPDECREDVDAVALRLVRSSQARALKIAVHQTSEWMRGQDYERSRFWFAVAARIADLNRANKTDGAGEH